MNDKLRYIFGLLLKPSFLVKVMVLMTLTEMHEYTKYKLCRSIQDLFYWPEGFCADTVVISLFFVFVFLVLLDYFQIIKSIHTVED